MKNILTSLLSLVIMIIGLALIIGGPGAVRFLFAPFLSIIRQAARVIFVALVVLVLLAAAISGKRSTPHQTRTAAVPPSQTGVANVANLAVNGEARDGH